AALCDRCRRRARPRPGPTPAARPPAFPAVPEAVGRILHAPYEPDPSLPPPVAPLRMPPPPAHPRCPQRPGYRLTSPTCRGPYTAVQEGTCDTTPCALSQGATRS